MNRVLAEGCQGKIRSVRASENAVSKFEGEMKEFEGKEEI